MRPFVALPRNEEHLADDARRVARIRELRVGIARRAGWEELPARRLERRARWLVDVETDALFLPYAGTVWQMGSARLVAEQKDLTFYVDDDGDVVVLERQPRTWSALEARRAKRSART